MISFHSRSEPSLATSLFTGVAMFGFFTLVFVSAAAGISYLAFGAEALSGFTPGEGMSREGLVTWRMIQASYGLGGFLTAGYFALRFAKLEVLPILEMPRMHISLILAAVLPIVMLPLIIASGYLNEVIPFPEALSGLREYFSRADRAADEMMMLILKPDGISDLIVNILLVAAIPAAGEELFFRGFLQRVFARKMNAHAAIWIAAAVFSLFHLQYSGFLPRLFLGALSGYLFYLSGSLWTAVIAHFFNNAFAVVMSYIYGVENVLKETSDLMFSPGEIALCGVSGVLTAVGILLFKNLQTKRNDKGEKKSEKVPKETE